MAKKSKRISELPRAEGVLAGDIVPITREGENMGVDLGGAVEYTREELNKRINEVGSLASRKLDESLFNSFIDYGYGPLKSKVEGLQKTVDGVIETFCYPYPPSITGYPANTWKTIEEKGQHLGDVFINIAPVLNEDGTVNEDAGKAWRWSHDDNKHTGFHWHPIADSDAVRALQMAQMAVTDFAILYRQTDSNSVAPDLPTTDDSGTITDFNGWSAASPAWAEGKYIWQTFYIKKGDGVASFSDPTCVSGHDGKDGASYTPNLLIGTVDRVYTATRDIDYDGIDLKDLAGEKITISYDYEYINVTTGDTQWNRRFGLEPYLSTPSGNIYLGAWVWLTANSTGLSGKGKKVVTATLPAEILVSRTKEKLNIQVGGGTVKIWNIKIERGANANPQWTPAASEMAASEQTKHQAFIDLATAIPGVSYNNATGLFRYELIFNGVDMSYDDITYEEMLNMYNLRVSGGDLSGACNGIKRVNLAPTNIQNITQANAYCFNNATIETCVVGNGASSRIVNGILYCSALKRVAGTLSAPNDMRATTFMGCANLEDVFINRGSQSQIYLSQLPKLSLRSIAYVVRHYEDLGSTCSIHVHKDVFAKLTDETNTEWHAIYTEAASTNAVFVSNT